MHTAADILTTWNAMGLGVTKLRQVDDDVLKFHAEAQRIVKTETERARKGAASVDSGLRPEVASARRRAAFELSRVRAEKLIAQARESILGARVKVAAELVDRRVQEKRPKDPLEAMQFTMRVNDARTQLQALGLTERTQALHKLADAGDPRLPDILQDAVVPVVPMDVAGAFLETWRLNTAGPAAEYLTASTVALEEAQDVSAAALVASLHQAASHDGVRIFEPIRPADVVDALEPSVKARFTAANGPDALAEVASGVRPLSELADLA